MNVTLDQLAESNQRMRQMTDFTSDELKKFDRLTMRLSSHNQMDRIDARLRLKEFVQEHGQEKCDAMFAVLQQKDKKRGVKKP